MGEGNQTFRCEAGSDMTAVLKQLTGGSLLAMNTHYFPQTNFR
jgi:hypothetical protein